MGRQIAVGGLRVSMARKRIYLDYNASAPLLGTAREAILSALDAANPSSVHADGRSSRSVVDTARRQVAALVGAQEENVVFTSGASEAAAMLLTPEWQMGRAPLKFSRLYISAAEHPCVLSGGRFARDRVQKIGVDANGILDVDALQRALAAHDRAEGLPLVACHLANNETGVIQPFEKIGRITKNAGGVSIFDAVQAVGRIHVDIADGYADFLMLSAHKIGGPKGAGAIVGVSDLMMPTPLIGGGGQEKGHRAGTENVAGISGFGMAAKEAAAGLAKMDSVRAKRDQIEKAIKECVPDAVIYGEHAPRLPNTVFFSIPRMKAETAQIAFDLEGISLSAGSACSSGKVGPSHVLKAMGIQEKAGALRVSIGLATTGEEIKAFSEALKKITARRRERNAAA